MSYIYQWDILESEVSDYNSSFPDTLKRVKFALVAIDADSNGEETSFIMKDVYFPNPTEGDFIPFSQLKHSDFVNFIVKICGEKDIQYMKDSLVAELEERKVRKAQKSELKSPWSTDEPIVLEDITPKFNNQLDYLLSQTQPK